MWAAACGNTALLKALLTILNANVNATDDRGETALHHAARNGRHECVAILLAHPSTRILTNAQGFTPRILVERKLTGLRQQLATGVRHFKNHLETQIENLQMVCTVFDSTLNETHDIVRNSLSLNGQRTLPSDILHVLLRFITFGDISMGQPPSAASAAAAAAKGFTQEFFLRLSSITSVFDCSEVVTSWLSTVVAAVLGSD